DADSVPFDLAGSGTDNPEHAGSAEGKEKKEGAFYVWSEAEIDALLGGDAVVVKRRFGVEPDGNAPEDPHGEFTGQNILYTAAPIDEIATATGRSVDTIVD